MYRKPIWGLFLTTLFVAACGSPYKEAATGPARVFVRAGTQYFDAGCVQNLNGSTQVQNCAISTRSLQDQLNFGSNATSTQSTANSSTQNTQVTSNIYLFALSQFVEAIGCAYLRQTFPCYARLGLTSPVQSAPCSSSLLNSPSPSTYSSNPNCQAPLPQPSNDLQPVNSQVCNFYSNLLNQVSQRTDFRACNDTADCTFVAKANSYCDVVPARKNRGSQTIIDYENFGNSFRQNGCLPRTDVACTQGAPVVTCKNIPGVTGKVCAF